ncbi:MAG: acetyl-CoA carboxylase biotin carboxyl carrier protein [Opitutaceae bacterium]|nr:acetyl-CoA carboxylase biotin carboxyl carrier protein [Opitutaceae bacterium]
MDLKQIKQIIDLMKRSDLTDFSVEEEGFKLSIRRNSSGQPIVAGEQYSTPLSAATDRPTMGPAPASPIMAASPSVPPTGGNDEVGITYIKSPMVGTFYRSPSPESPPFTDLNAKVSENSVVCIIEAMKIMNEIQAETKGTILEIFVENGQPVEYGQRLFKVKVG